MIRRLLTFCRPAFIGLCVLFCLSLAQRAYSESYLLSVGQSVTITQSAYGGGYIDNVGLADYIDPHLSFTKNYDGSATITVNSYFEYTTTVHLVFIERYYFLGHLRAETYYRDVDITCKYQAPDPSKKPTKVTVPERVRVSLGEKVYVTPSIEPYGAIVTKIAWYKSSGGFYYNMQGSGTPNDLRGIVTGKSLGLGRAYVELDDDENLRAYFDIEVVDPNNLPPTGIVLPSSYEISVGGHTTIEPILSPEKSSTSYTWSSDNTNVAIVTGGKVTGIAVGTATITVKTANNLTASCTVKVVKANGQDDETEDNNATMGILNGREYVDLGLSVKWATYDVGASKQGEEGPKFAWGEVESKTDFSWSNYKYGTDIFNVTNIGSDIKGTKYDAAYVNWGSDWCMPNATEAREMLSKCTFSIDTINGVKGYRVVGPNGNSMFFPVVGRHWTSSLSSKFSENATSITISRNSSYPYNWVTSYSDEMRMYGRYVRAVTSTDATISSSQPSSVSLEATSIKVKKGKKIPMQYSVYPTNVTTTLRWESSNPSVASVSGSGLVTTIKDGTAVISLTTGNGKVAQCTLTVGENTTTSKLVLSASPSGGQVTAGTIVYLTAKADGSTVSNCDIYYTLNGATPSKSSTKYTSSGIAINSDCTLKAIAYKDGYEDSEVLTATYTVKTEQGQNYYIVGGPSHDWFASAQTKEYKFSKTGISTYTITFPADEYDTWFAFGDDEALDAITNEGDWSKLYGTTKGQGNNGFSGTFARRSSLTDDGSFYVPFGAETITMDIDISNMTYKITTSGNMPSPKLVLSASPSGGQVMAGTTVYLTAKADGSTVSNCDIYYTLNGATPSKSSTKYTSAGIAINSDCTLRAIAYKDGYETSNELNTSYTVIGNTNGIAINTTNFPDENFRNYLLSQSYGQDGVLTDTEIKGIRELYVDSKSIRNLKGVEFFTTLEYLYCSDNQLTALNVSKNTALTMLFCYNNHLTSLDVSKNTALILLFCLNNQLPYLDVSENTALEQLFCYNNQLTALDVSKNTALKDLYCDGNQLKDLDVSKNSALTKLYCYNNQLTALDVSKNMALIELDCSGNQLTALDVSKNTALKWLYCSDNQLTALDVSKNTALTYLYCDGNQLTALDVSKNTALTYLHCYRNRIKKDAMEVLINSLPQNTSTSTNDFLVYDNRENDEGNVCTKSQVAAAKAKGWLPLYYNVKKEEWENYEGSEDPVKQKVSINLAPSGYATFYSSESAYTLPSGLLAQVVTSAANNKLTYETIANGAVSGVVPMGVPVMIVSNVKQAGIYTLTPTESATTYRGTNLLHGSDEGTMTTGNGYHYKLTYGPTNSQWSNVFGWYWGTNNGNPFRIEGHKAWLVVPKDGGTRSAGFTIEGEAMSITELEDGGLKREQSVFDLQGRRLDQPTKKGLYIKNGQKVVVR